MINKTGSPSKINKVATSDGDFEAMRNKIAQDNNLVRCNNCNKLLSKRSSDNKITEFQHKHLVASIKDASEIVIQCPSCGGVNKLH